MVRIRLVRVGGKKQPTFRIVAMDKESPRNGRYLEMLGYYNPRTQPFTFKVQEDRIYDWMNKGAQPTDSVAQLFKSTGVLNRYERLKAGESLDKLLEEAEAEAKNRNTNPKTRQD